MTVATTDVRNRQHEHLADRLRRGASAIRDMAAALHARWRAALDAGQLGPDPETIIGRSTGARI